ncbi:conserved hypothetical protein [Brochothrix thermosphacta]|nr:conserved hypothetical protein [Brochothrix thermosphacta]
MLTCVGSMDDPLHVLVLFPLIIPPFTNKLLFYCIEKARICLMKFFFQTEKNTLNTVLNHIKTITLRHCVQNKIPALPYNHHDCTKMLGYF